jgi:hypothetical protein
VISRLKAAEDLAKLVKRRSCCSMGFMKVRHAAAFALAGWYLMLPPMRGGRPEESAPLSQWVIIESFNTAKECNMLLEADAESRTHFTPATEPLLQASAAECIATDDPRFKGN